MQRSIFPVLLPRVFARSVEGVFYAQLFTDAVVLLLGVILMVSAFRKIRAEEVALPWQRESRRAS